ncbi:hypothetical protein ABFS82_08G094100 [Erythranthe guttata]|uniref:calcium uniporter protein 2, mitochondrial-like n=1 Tax=Erythranthe guttata TaxID=4155 RepID=UPI00064DE64A|nr:PREDICTED: calcium uniporter protein 2, mitochondrial-like [Erythranthe guttata]|eukprot:XP_012853681.1 PREDICTED: calcium uniporter protein 2, mitochondrial-like [Erythranthe guttata]
MWFLPTGEKLLEKLREMEIAKDRFRLDSLTPAAAAAPSEGSLTVKDAVKILKISQVQMVKLRLRQIPGNLRSRLLEHISTARIRQDQSGTVIVLEHRF